MRATTSAARTPRASSGRSARASPAGSPATRSSIHCNQASYEDPEVHGLDPMAAPSQKIWGYETTWGSFAQFSKVQAQQLVPKPKHLSWEEAASYGLTYFTAYRMLIDQAKLQAGHRVLIWGAAGGLGVFAMQLCKIAGASASASCRRPTRASWSSSSAPIGYINRNEFAGMMRQRRRDARGGEGALQGVAPLRQARQGDARRRARHRLRARRPGDVPDLGAVASSRSARSSSAARRPASTSTSTCATCGCGRSRSSARTSPTPGRRRRPTS